MRVHMFCSLADHIVRLEEACMCAQRLPAHAARFEN